MDINKVYNIDCFYGMGKMQNKSVDHVFTSPPYNRKRNDKYSFYDDTLNDYQLFLEKVINESLRISKKYVFLNLQKNYYNKREIYSIIGKYAEKIIDIIIWNKSNPTPASGNSITNSYEFIIVLSDDLQSLKSNSTYVKNTFTSSAFTNNPYNKIHKAVMNPIACNYIIQNFTKENDIIVDPFTGVGTTPLCCIENDRNFIGFETSLEYYNITSERICDSKDEKYKCQYCGKFITNAEGITCVGGEWVCDSNSCRNTVDDGESYIK